VNDELVTPQSARERCLAWDFLNNCPEGFTVAQIRRGVSTMIKERRLQEPLR
jgi:hypothetical protein